MSEVPLHRGLWLRAAALFSSHRPRLVSVALLAVASSVLGVVSPLLVRSVVDDALFSPTGPRLGLLYLLCGLIAIASTVSAAAGVVQVRTSETVAQQIVQELRYRLFSHVQTLSIRFFTDARAGDLQSRLDNDIGSIQTAVADTATTALSNTVTFVVTVATMSYLSGTVTFFMLLLLPVFVGLSTRVGRARRRLAEEAHAELAEMSVVALSNLSVSGAMLSKVFGGQAAAASDYEARSQAVARLEVRQQYLGRLLFSLVATFFSLTPIVVYVVAGLQLRAGARVSVGTLVALTTLQIRLFLPVAQLLQSYTELSGSLAVFRRVFEILDLEPEILDPVEPVPFDPRSAKGRVEFRGVSFSYGGAGARPADGLAVDDVSFVAEPGRLVAVVGATGAGKTTLGYLLARFYDNDCGSVTVDGVDIRHLTRNTLTETIGVVTQETYLLHASVADNLRYAHPTATHAEMVKAAEDAMIHQRILELADGYDTVVGDRGFRLSGGEKQRLAIARVMLRAPKVLFLDEATSSLDTVSERRIQEALDRLMRGRTTIAVAHRLSTVVSADTILVMHGGRVVERGDHASLLSLDGRYAKMYATQFGRPGGGAPAGPADISP